MTSPNTLTTDQVRQLLAEMVPKDVFDTEEAARYLSVSPALLELLRVEGGGPRYAKLSRLVRYRRESLDQWLLQLERSHTAKR